MTGFEPAAFASRTLRHSIVFNGSRYLCHIYHHTTSLHIARMRSYCFPSAGSLRPMARLSIFHDGRSDSTCLPSWTICSICIYCSSFRLFYLPVSSFPPMRHNRLHYIPDLCPCLRVCRLCLHPSRTLPYRNLPDPDNSLSFRSFLPGPVLPPGLRLFVL